MLNTMIKLTFRAQQNVSIQKNQSSYIITKRFVLDAVLGKNFRTAASMMAFTRWCERHFAKLYLKHKNISPFFNSIMELRNVAKIENKIQKVKTPR